MLTIDTILEQAQGLLDSRALPYVLAGVLLILWWAGSTTMGLLRRGRPENVERPRRRLPLD
ncbi:MAG: hypothetical protein O2782_01170 [bacterium]|nr:hypothetical protein [bacterium]